MGLRVNPRDGADEVLGERHHAVLEVGALNDPVFRKEEGEVWFADYFTRAESIDQLRNNPRHPAEGMVEVDFVLCDRTLSEAVTIQTGLTIANHVIEHLHHGPAVLADRRADAAARAFLPLWQGKGARAAAGRDEPTG